MRTLRNDAVVPPVSLTELRPQGKNDTLLPMLDPIVDTHSLEFAYAGSRQHVSSNITITTNDDEDSVIYDYSSPSYDQRIQDAITIFTRDVTNNICDSSTPSCGTIQMSIAAANIRQRGLGLLLASTLLLWTPQLVGVPIGFYETQLDVDVEIFDRNDNIVGRYNTLSKSNVVMALYYGYGFDANRESALACTQKGYAEIKYPNRTAGCRKGFK